LITLACLKCNTAIRTVGDNREVFALLGHGCEWYPDKYPCPKAGCDGLAQFMEAVAPTALSQLEIHDLTPYEAFAAFNGLGFPPERDCGETAVREAFKQSISKVGVRQLRGENRSVIDWIEFTDGVRIYLAASGAGAVVYRIARPFRYTEAVDG
jgi:hypothetical protein